MDLRPLYDDSEEGPVLRLHVQPGSGRSQVTGTFGNALKIKVAAPPEGGRANAAVIDLLSRALEIDEKAIELTSGEKSRSKRVLVRGVDGAALERALEKAMEGEPRRSGSKRRP
jgi:uncharacterized protein (TIGR00251 family)